MSLETTRNHNGSTDIKRTREEQIKLYKCFSECMQSVWLYIDVAM